ncbi:MAG: SDR family oxidoreductase [Actinobacteria bacterium]|nr:SDR family oxidoreductase [Actinomycetota bacterium]
MPAEHADYAGMFDLTGRVAVVAGGEIGREICLALAAFGAKVAVYDLQVEDAGRVVGAVEERGGFARAYKVDVTVPESIDRALDDVVENLGGVDICVNNAGIVTRAPAEEMLDEQWLRVMDVNLTGTFNMCRAAGRIMIRQNRDGRLINVASILGERAVPGRVSYVTSKGGVIQLTRALAVEWAKYGITVNALSPGYVNTAMVGPMLRAEPEFYDYIIGHTPQRKIVEPSELAGMIVFLASHASRAVTGQNLCVDGGWSAM